MMIDCGPCKDGRHGDCIKVNECLCYSYAEVHADWADDSPALQLKQDGDTARVRILSPFGGVRHLPAYDEDDTDGGLGSGRWLMEEMP